MSTMARAEVETRMGLKLLHTADLHLDRPFPALGPRQAERRAETRARFVEILRLAKEHEVDALLIAGDLFDRPAADSGFWVMGHLQAIAACGIRVFLIPGNHDPYEQCAFYHAQFPEGVYVFTTPEFEVCEELPGLSLYGLAYHEAGRSRSPLAGLTPRPGRRWQVALVHGQLRSSGLVGEDYAPIEPAEIESSGLDYLALGHYHSFADHRAGRTRACYPGSPHRLDFGDAAERRALLVRLDDGGVSVEPLPLPDRRFLQIEGDAARPQDLYARLIEEAGPDACLRVRLAGRAGEPVAGLIADLEDKFAGQCYSFEVQAGEAATDPPASQEGTVANVFARLMRERLAAAQDKAAADLARLALDYGLLALEGRRLP